MLTWTDSGHRIVVWKWTSGHSAWTQQAVVKVPSPVGEPNPPQVTGAVISGATDATFVLTGVFSGDGVANAVVLAHGPHRWGLLDRTSPATGSLSVDPAGTAWYAAGFRNRMLVTADLNPFYPNSDGGRFPVDTYWHYSGPRVVEVEDNVTEAGPAPEPPTNPRELPDACPRTPADGTFRTSVEVQDIVRKNSVTGDAVRLTFPTLGPGPGQCSVPVSADLPTTFPVADNGWVSGPVWMALYANDHANRPDLRIPLPAAAHQPGTRWYVPGNIGVTALRAPDGGATWILTFRNGKVVSAVD